MSVVQNEFRFDLRYITMVYSLDLFYEHIFFFYLNIIFTHKSLFLICTFYFIHRFFVAKEEKKIRCRPCMCLCTQCILLFWAVINTPYNEYLYEKNSSWCVICLEIWFSMDESIIISFRFFSAWRISITLITPNAFNQIKR